MFDSSLKVGNAGDDSAQSNSPAATVLLLEDQHDQMVLMTHMLNKAGFQVVPAYGGEDALHKMKAQRIDLLMTDLGLPKVSGLEVIAGAKADPQTRDIPVLVVSGYRWEEQGHAALKAGADGYVSKPFTSQHLVEEVNRQLDGTGRLRLAVGNCSPIHPCALCRPDARLGADDVRLAVPATRATTRSLTEPARASVA